MEAQRSQSEKKKEGIMAVKVKVIEPVKHDGKRREIGETIEVSNKLAKELIEKGLARKNKEEKDQKPATPAEILEKMEYADVISLAGELGHEKPTGVKKDELVEFILDKGWEPKS